MGILRTIPPGIVTGICDGHLGYSGCYIKAIKPENRWNIDKAGIIEGQGENGLVVRSVD